MSYHTFLDLVVGVLFMLIYIVVKCEFWKFKAETRPDHLLLWMVLVISLLALFSGSLGLFLGK